MKVLFVCSGNIRRSRTAHDIFTSEKYPGHEFKSCGTYTGWIKDNQDGEAVGAVPISEELVEWADIIYCMEREHQETIKYDYGRFFAKKCVVLDVPDIFLRGDEMLIEILKEKIVLPDQPAKSGSE